jgi:positive regulator of sigma E activity
MKNNDTTMTKSWLMFAGYFGYVMVLFYLVLGLGFLLTNIFQEFISTGNLRTALGILLILYSIFRAFRIYKKVKEIKDENK